MPINGQASGDFTESSSALRILYVGHRNSFAADLTTDAFTQTNPPIVATNVSTTLSSTPKYGVLSGSVAFTRPDGGQGYIGGPLAAAPASGALTPLGFFINDAVGNAYENTPGPASGKGPYVSAQGTMGSQLYETQNLDSGADLTYAPGDKIVASLNGYITNVDDQLNAVESAFAAADGSGTVLGIVKIAPDSTLAEILFDLRV